MPITVNHVLTATTPDDPAYEIRPSHWNSAHVAVMSATAGTEVFGAFSNDPAFNVSFSTNAGGQVVASANVTAAPSPVNITGANGSSVNAQTVAFSNSNGVTLGVSTAANGATITGSHNALTSQSNQAFSASGGSSAFQTLGFSNANGFTFSNSNGSVVGSYTVPTQSQQPMAASAANGSFTANTLSFSNANGISFGTSAGSAITASHNAITTARASNDGVGLNTAQTNVTWTVNSSGLSLNAAGYAGTGTAVTGNASVTLNSNGLSFNGSNLAGVGTSVTGGAAVTLNSNGLAFNGASLAGTSSGFTGANISATITHNTAGWAMSASVAAPGGGGNFSAGVSTGGNTSGDTGITGTRMVFAGGNNITLSQATDANGATITFSGANAGGAQTGISGIVVSNTTYTSGTVTFQNANGISFGSSGANGISASYTVPTQTNQTIGGYFVGNTTGQSSSSTVDARSFSFDGAGIVSAGWSNGTVRISATQSVQTQASGDIARSGFTSAGNNIGLSGTLNSGGLSLSATVAAQSVQPVAVSAANGSYAFSTLSFSNANGMSFGTSAGSAVTGSYTVPSVTQYFSATNTTFNGANISGSMTLNTNGLQLSMSVAAPGAAAENNNINLLGANTAGNTTASGSTIGYSGINLTLSGTNGSVVNISAPATSSLVGFQGITVSTNGSTISVGQQMGSYFGNMNGEWQNSAALQFLQSTSHVQPFVLEGPVSFGFIRIPMSAAMAASTTAATTGNTQFSYGQTRTHNFVIYSRGTGANSQSLQSVMSTSFTDQQSHNISANANSTQFSYSNRFTYYMSTGTTGFTYDYSSSAASLNYHTSGMTGVTGNKVMEFPWSNSLAPGMYWLMYGVSSSTASQFTNVGTRWFNLFSNYGITQPNLAFGTIGAATNSSVGPFFGVGSFTTAGGGTTASLPISAITTSGSHNKIFFQMLNIA